MRRGIIGLFAKGGKMTLEGRVYGDMQRQRAFLRDC